MPEHNSCGEETRYYVLNDADQPVQCRSVDTWVRWMESSSPQRLLKETEVGSYVIRTTFTGLDQARRHRGPALLYQTEIIETDGQSSFFENESWQWYNRIEAAYGHDIVARTIHDHVAASLDDEAIYSMLPDPGMGD